MIGCCQLRIRCRRPTRRMRCSGQELVEFSLTLLPLLAIVSVYLSIAWGIFAKSALQYAAKTAVRQGITKDKTATGGLDITSVVKGLVQQNSFGFLKDTTLVHVHYYQPPMPGSTAAVTDVSTITSGASQGNSAGNLMVVSVDNYQLPALIARVFTWNKSDKSASTISVSSADIIEQIDPQDLAPLGTAP